MAVSPAAGAASIVQSIVHAVGPALGALAFCVALGIKRKRAFRPERFTTAPQGFVVSTPTMAIEYPCAVM